MPIEFMVSVPVPEEQGSHREQAAKGASITQQSGGTIYSEG